MLSNFENTKALVNGSGYEKMGLYDLLWSDTCKKWIAEGKYPVKMDANGDEIPVSGTDFFNWDMQNIWSTISPLPLKDYSEVIDESDEWIVRRNGAGASLKYWKNKTGTPEHINFRMTSREIWERDYRPYLLEYDESRIDFDQAKESFDQAKEANKYCYYGTLFIWELMRVSLGDICMFESFLLDPEWIKDFNRVYTNFYKMHYKALFDKGLIPDCIWIYEDLGYKNGLYCSPKTLKELIVPYYKEIVDFFHSYGLPVIFHSCGNITDALDLIVECGYDGLNPMEVKAGCDLLAFADKYADELVFVGGIDARILASGNRDLIKQETLRLIKGMKARNARWFAGSDHSVPSDVNFDDYMYMLKIIDENKYY